MIGEYPLSQNFTCFFSNTRSHMSQNCNIKVASTTFLVLKGTGGPVIVVTLLAVIGWRERVPEATDNYSFEKY